MKKLLMLTVALLVLTGCDSDKDKAIKAAEAKITAMTDNITGITFSDMEYFPDSEGAACVRGKYRTESMRERRFVVDVKFKNTKTDTSPPFIENPNFKSDFESMWNSFCDE